MTGKIGSLTRMIAIDALTHVLTRRIHADVALDRLFNHYKDLRPIDRAFIFELTYGCLRWMAKMDWIMSKMVSRPFNSLDPRVQNALRVGCYQVYYMDRVPNRAAVAETVEAIKRGGVPKASTLVNAVLRRVSKKAEYFQKPDKETETISYYAMHFSHPKWMVKRWMKLLPRERLEYMLAGHNQLPKLTVRQLQRRPFKGKEDLGTVVLRNHGIHSNWRPLKNSLQLEKLPDFKNCEAFQEGHYIVQDEAAQLCSSLIDFQPEDKVLDACAAPGGKSIYLWDMGVEPENLTVADYSKKRLERLEENFKRVGLEGARIVHGDIKESLGKEKFDKILLDAPCSAMGVIRRHPEIRWLRVLADIKNCAKEQAAMLSQMTKNLADGGELLYVVCSVEKEETTLQIDSFLKRHKDFKIVPLERRIHEYYRKYVSKSGQLVIYPGNSDGLDGFFACLLKRKEY